LSHEIGSQDETHSDDAQQTAKTKVFWLDDQVNATERPLSDANQTGLGGRQIGGSTTISNPPQPHGWRKFKFKMPAGCQRRLATSRSDRLEWKAGEATKRRQPSNDPTVSKPGPGFVPLNPSPSFTRQLDWFRCLVLALNPPPLSDFGGTVRLATRLALGSRFIVTVTRSTPVTASCQVREPAAVNDVDWSALREAEFPVGRRYAYFDHAAVAPLPRRAVEAMTTWANDLGERGDAQWLSWYDRLADYRRGLADLIAADPGEIAFIPNTTHGVGLIAEGFPWQPGDRIVLPEDEYPSNVYPWMNLASRGVGLDRVPTRAGRILLDDLAAAIGPQTRLLAISHVEFATGFRNDLDAVGQLCQQRGVALFVDAIQGLGPLRIDVSRTPIDFLAADGHKWLLGPEGAGFLYVRTCWIQRLRPIMVGWHSVTRAFDHGTIDFTLKTTAQRWEGGTFNMPGLHALGASVSLFHEVGPDRIAGRILERARAVATLARDLGLEVFGGFGPSEDSGIVSIVIPEALGGPAQAAARLKERDVILSARGGRLRVSPHCYTNDEDLQRLHDGLSALCRG